MLNLSHLSSGDKLLNYITKAFKPIQQLLRTDSSTWWETALQLQLPLHNVCLTAKGIFIGEKQRFQLGPYYVLSFLNMGVEWEEGQVFCLLRIRPTLFLTSALWQRNAFLAVWNPASKQAGTGRMWAELSTDSTLPGIKVASPSPQKQKKNNSEGLSSLQCFPWLVCG